MYIIYIISETDIYSSEYAAESRRSEIFANPSLRLGFLRNRVCNCVAPTRLMSVVRGWALPDIRLVRDGVAPVGSCDSPYETWLRNNVRRARLCPARQGLFADSKQFQVVLRLECS